MSKEINKNFISEYYGNYGELKSLFPGVQNEKGEDITDHLIVFKQAAWVYHTLKKEIDNTRSEGMFITDMPETEKQQRTDLADDDLYGKLKIQENKNVQYLKNGSLDLTSEIMIGNNSLIMTLIDSLANYSVLVYFKYLYTHSNSGRYDTYESIIKSDITAWLTDNGIKDSQMQTNIYKKIVEVLSKIRYGTAVLQSSTTALSISFNNLLESRIYKNVAILSTNQLDYIKYIEIYNSFKKNMKYGSSRLSPINGYAFAGNPSIKRLTDKDIALLGLLIKLNKDKSFPELKNSKFNKILKTLAYDGKYGYMTEELSLTLSNLIRDCLCSNTGNIVRNQIFHSHIHQSPEESESLISDHGIYTTENEEYKTFIKQQKNTFCDFLVKSHVSDFMTSQQVKLFKKSHPKLKLKITGTLQDYTQGLVPVLDKTLQSSFLKNCQPLLFAFNHAIVNTYFKNFGDDGKIDSAIKQQIKTDITPRLDQLTDKSRLSNMSPIYNVFPKIVDILKTQNTYFQIGLLCAIITSYGLSDNKLNIVLNKDLLLNNYGETSVSFTKRQKIIDFSNDSSVQAAIKDFNKVCEEIIKTQGLKFKISTFENTPIEYNADEEFKLSMRNTFKVLPKGNINLENIRLKNVHEFSIYKTLWSLHFKDCVIPDITELKNMMPTYGIESFSDYLKNPDSGIEDARIEDIYRKMKERFDVIKENTSIISEADLILKVPSANIDSVKQFRQKIINMNILSKEICIAEFNKEFEKNKQLASEKTQINIFKETQLPLPANYKQSSDNNVTKTNISLLLYLIPSNEISSIINQFYNQKSDVLLYIQTLKSFKHFEQLYVKNYRTTSHLKTIIYLSKQVSTEYDTPEKIIHLYTKLYIKSTLISNRTTTKFEIKIKREGAYELIDKNVNVITSVSQRESSDTTDLNINIYFMHLSDELSKIIHIKLITSINELIFNIITNKEIQNKIYILYKYILPIFHTLEWKQYILGLIEIVELFSTSDMFKSIKLEFKDYSKIIDSNDADENYFRDREAIRILKREDESSDVIQELDKIKQGRLSEQNLLTKEYETFKKAGKLFLYYEDNATMASIYNAYCAYTKAVLLLHLKYNTTSPRIVDTDEIKSIVEKNILQMQKDIKEYVKEVCYTSTETTIHRTRIPPPHIQLYQLLDNRLLIDSIVSGNKSLSLVTLSSYLGCFEPIPFGSAYSSGLTFEFTKHGALILKNGQTEINIYEELIGQDEEFCKAFGAEAGEFGPDANCPELFANCLAADANDEFRCRELIKEINIQKEVSLWRNLDPDRRRYAAYRVLFGLKINGIVTGNIRSFVNTNGTPYMTDDEIKTLIGLNGTPQHELILKYIKDMLIIVDKIQFTTENSTVPTKGFGQGIPAKFTFPLHEPQYEVLPYIGNEVPIQQLSFRPRLLNQFGQSGGSLKPINILYGGNIKDNIYNIVSPIKTTLNNIEAKGIIIKPAKIQKIKGILDTLIHMADDLDHAEEVVNTYRTMMSNNPQLSPITDYDFNDALKRLEQKKEEMGKNISRANGIQNMLNVRFNLN